MAIKTLIEGEPTGLLFIGWIGAGVFGLCGLVGAARRVGAPQFRLKAWEIAGMVCGFVGSIPFFFLVSRAASFTWSSLLILVPIVLSDLTGVAIITADYRHRG